MFIPSGRTSRLVAQRVWPESSLASHSNQPYRPDWPRLSVLAFLSLLGNATRLCPPPYTKMFRGSVTRCGCAVVASMAGTFHNLLNSWPSISACLHFERPAMHSGPYRSSTMGTNMFTGPSMEAPIQTTHHTYTTK